MSFSDATLEAMQEEMRRDPTVFLMGEDIAKQGGIFGQFKDLPQEFGLERVRDTPISEAALVGAGVGAALTGCRPVVDMHFADFITCAMDEVVNQAAKLRYMFGEQCSVPMTLRAPDGITKSAGSQHSQALEAWFVHTPGLEVVVPGRRRGCQGTAQGGHSQRQPDPVLRAQAALPAEGRGAGRGRLRGADRPRQDHARRPRRRDRHLRHHGRARAGGGRGAGDATASRPR